MTTRTLARRIAEVERKATAGGLRVVVQPAGLEGEALAVWEHLNLGPEKTDELTVIVQRFGSNVACGIGL